MAAPNNAPKWIPAVLKRLRRDRPYVVISKDIKMLWGATVSERTLARWEMEQGADMRQPNASNLIMLSLYFGLPANEFYTPSTVPTGRSKSKYIDTRI